MQIKLMISRILLSLKLIEMKFQFNRMMLHKEIQKHINFKDRYLMDLHKMIEGMLRNKKMKYRMKILT